MATDIAFETAFTLPARVRSYEVARDGDLSIANALRYLEFLATEASAALGFSHDWYVAHGAAWLVREMHIRLGALPQIGDDVTLATWLSEWRKVQAYREYAIWRPAPGRIVARARARWAYVDLARGAPIRVPDDLVARFAPLGPPMRVTPRTLVTADSAGSVSTLLRLLARATEADVNQHINNCVYADWLTEALHHALDEQPALLAGSRYQPREYTIEYLRPSLPGDPIRIETALALSGSRALLASQHIYHDASGVMLVRSSSRHLLTRLAR
ncbi:MAG: acyl-[acyl-carrier-protein] thioesterase [Ktedonobacterales bacterium]